MTTLVTDLVDDVVSAEKDAHRASSVIQESHWVKSRTSSGKVGSLLCHIRDDGRMVASFLDFEVALESPGNQTDTQLRLKSATK